MGRPLPFSFFSASGCIGATRRSAICCAVRYFGNRFSSFGNAMFLIGDISTAPCRMRNL